MPRACTRPVCPPWEQRTRSVFTNPRPSNIHRHGDSRYTTPCRGRCRQRPPILRNLGRMPTATTKLSSLSRRRTFARRTPPLACTPLFDWASSRRCGEQARRRLLAHRKNCGRCPSGSWRAIFVRPSAGSVSAFVLVYGLMNTKYSVVMKNEAMEQRSAETWHSHSKTFVVRLRVKSHRRYVDRCPPQISSVSLDGEIANEIRRMCHFGWALTNKYFQKKAMHKSEPFVVKRSVERSAIYKSNLSALRSTPCILVGAPSSRSSGTFANSTKSSARASAKHGNYKPSSTTRFHAYILASISRY